MNGTSVLCAAAIRDQLEQVGLATRVGIHTGEVEFCGGDIGGFAVHIAARVVDEAGPGRMVVSGTVRDLVVGSGMVFDSVGTFDLKGVPGEGALFSVKA